MKKKKFACCLLGLMATVISCQRDDQLIIQDEHSKEKMDVQIKKYNFNTLSKQERFREAYDRVFVKNANSVGGLSKTIMEQDYGFTIDSSLIKEVTVQGYTSYTFLIHRDSIATNYFENLVVTIDSVNTTKAYIIKYTLNTPPVYIVEDDAYTLDAQKELTPINYNTNQAKLSFVDEDGCTIITLMCPFGDDGPHPATQVCINQDRGDLYWDYDSSNCDSSGGGGGTSGSGSDGSAGNGSDGSSGGGGGGGGTSGGSNDDGGLDTGCKGCGDTGGPIITDPVLEEEIDQSDDIARLNQIVNNTLIRVRIDQMVNDLNTSTTEQGSEFRRVSDNVYSEYVIPSTDLSFSKTKFPTAQIDTRIRLHMHHNTQDNIGNKIQTVFSLDDIMSSCGLYKKMDDLGSYEKDKVVSMLVSRRGLYAFTIDNPDKVLEFVDDIIENPSRVINGNPVTLNNYLIEQYEALVMDQTQEDCGGCDDNAEAALFELNFMIFLKKLDCGLHLYRAFLNNDGNYEWEQLI